MFHFLQEILQNFRKTIVIRSVRQQKEEIKSIRNVKPSQLSFTAFSRIAASTVILKQNRNYKYWTKKEGIPEIFSLESSRSFLHCEVNSFAFWEMTGKVGVTSENRGSDATRRIEHWNREWGMFHAYRKYCKNFKLWSVFASSEQKQ